VAKNDEVISRSCGAMDVHYRLLREVPGYAESRAAIENYAMRAAMRGPVARPGCTKIPVVVHVVYKTATQNISDAQIHSQIDVLNRDFRANNPDKSTVPAVFQPLIADVRIEFELATEDPDGNPTDGINRVPTDETSFNDDDSVKFTASGGADAWPSSKYLNLWVCNLSPYLGYAQFPGGPAATDGVVITYTGFGTMGTAAAPFDLGRTATHEIGHWLNLRHIWGDDGGGCAGSDLVADTPNQGNKHFGKPSFPQVSCGNGPNGDLFVNYMDYVDDDTMVMFTTGQVTRMQAVLDSTRSAIGTSIPCEKILKEGPKDNPKDFIKEFPKEPIKDLPKEGPKELHKDFPKDHPKDFVKEPPKDPPKDWPKEWPKEPIKEFPKDSPKEFQKEGIFDPGPVKHFQEPIGPVKHFQEPIGPVKSFQEPIGPVKSFQEPIGPVKHVMEGPGPVKGFMEPVGPVLPVTPIQPVTPVTPPVFPGPIVQPGIPFVLGTPHGAIADPQTQVAAAYLQLLSYYSQLHAGGMLDAAGMAAWQSAAATYSQLLGS
jgi:hypothetical protein